MATTQPASNRIKVANPALEDNNRTYLQSDSAVGATALVAVSTTGFPTTTDDDYYVIIGDYKDEKAEILLIDASATTDTGLTVSATKYSHSASDPITYIGYNQIQILGMESATGAKTVIASIAIDTTEQYTEYTYTGTTYLYFATAYLNETESEISGYSDTVGASTYTRFSTKKVIESAAIKAMTTVDDNKNAVLNWENTIEILQDGVDEILARKRKWPFLRTIGTGATVASQAYITPPTDVAQMVYIKVDNVLLDWISLLDYSRYNQSSVASSGKPVLYTERESLYYTQPVSNAVYTVTFDYFKRPETITSLTTEVEKPFLTPLIYYCASQFAYIRGNDTRGDKMYAIFEKLLEQQVIEYSGPEQSGFAEYVERTNTLSDAYLI